MNPLPLSLITYGYWLLHQHFGLLLQISLPILNLEDWELNSINSDTNGQDINKMQSAISKVLLLSEIRDSSE